MCTRIIKKYTQLYIKTYKFYHFSVHFILFIHNFKNISLHFIKISYNFIKIYKIAHIRRETLKFRHTFSLFFVQSPDS